LVRIAPEHAESVVRWRMQPENRARFLSDAEFTVAAQLRWTERSRNDSTDMTCVALRDGLPVGMVALYDMADRGAEYGRILVDDSCRRQRVGLAISGCVVAFGFGVLGLERIFANCLAQNAPIIGLLGLLGFTRIGAWRHEASGRDVATLEITGAAWAGSAACKAFERLSPSMMDASCASGLRVQETSSE
jgi:RimJ/RimL family protein N-acetyltransferase